MSHSTATCVIDQNAANTFDNHTYNHNIRNCWHVAMYTIAHGYNQSEIASFSQEDVEQDDSEKLAVLVRENDNKQKEFVIIAGQDNGEDQVIRIQPNGNDAPKLFINDKEHPLRSNKAIEHQGQDSQDAPLLRAHKLPNGEMRLEIRGGELEIVTDGYRAQIQASNRYRNQVGGLCGTFNENENDDQTAPNNRILRESDDFVGSWALMNGECKSEQNKAAHVRSQKATQYQKETIYGNIISEREAGRKQYRWHKDFSLEDDSKSSSSSSSSSSSR